MPPNLQSKSLDSPRLCPGWKLVQASNLRISASSVRYIDRPLSRVTYPLLPPRLLPRWN